MKDDAAGRRTAGWTLLLPWLIGGAVLASFLALVCSSYYLHATSDPIVWLNEARNFFEEFGKSRWPYGYPLYLRGMLELLGPYWVFLANLPALLGMFAVAGWLGTLFAGEDRCESAKDKDRKMPKSWGFLAVWIIILGANSGRLLSYVNPFRDPLSHLFLLASAGVFVHSLKTRRMWGVAAAGALLGLACSVREPSVLMLLPLFVYGWLAWRSERPALGFWRTIGAFAFGLVLGMAPMLVQSYLATHQVLVPHNLLLNVPETQEESKLVPGMYFNGSRLAEVAGLAWAYYWDTEKPLLVLSVVGLVAAICRRNRLVLSLVVPTAVGYAAFYAFYRMFVPRYFYVAVLFFSLLAGYGLLSLLHLLCTIRFPRLGRAAGWLLLAAVALASSARLLDARAKDQPHQAPQARAMADAIRQICPDASIIYAHRPLCEWIDWFVPCESRPLLDKSLAMAAPGAAGKYPRRDPETTAALIPRLERNERIYAAFSVQKANMEVDLPFVQRAVDLLPVGSFDPKLYHAEGYANGIVKICRLVAWTNRSVVLDWPVPECGERSGAYWFMVDVGDWPEGHAPADIAVAGAAAPMSPVPHGGTWVGWAKADASDAGRTVSATIASADLLPRAMEVRTGSLDEPLVLDFRIADRFDHFWRWTGDIFRPADVRGNPGVCIRSTGDLELPVPAYSDAWICLELMSDRMLPGSAIPVSVSENGRLLARTDVPGDRTLAQLLVPIPPATNPESLHLHLDVDAQIPPESKTGNDPAGIECTRAIIFRWPVSYPVNIELGTPGDGIHVRSGFTRPEGSGNSACRWTTGAAELAVYLPAGDRQLALAVEGSVGGMPAAVKRSAGRDLHVAWDGIELSGQLEWSDNGESFVWRGTLPPGTGANRMAHRLTLETPTWRPADFGLKDSRTLGVRIGRICIAPAE